MPIHLTHGDLLAQDDVDAIVNTVNCVGVMGKGIALQFKNKWPANYRAYEVACKAGEVRPGRMFVYDAGALAKPHFIINFPTKDHWRGKSTLAFIRDGLVDLVAHIQRLGIRSIAVPPLGCGNGGLNWADVQPLIEDAFARVPDVEVRLFAPEGTPSAKSMQVRTTRPAMTAGRAAILKVLDTYRQLNYGLSKIEVQKLAYFLQEAGQPMNLRFEKKQYGPYADGLRHALHRMEGHFIRGVGDGVAEADIEPLPDALAEADAFLAAQGHEDLLARVQRLEDLIDGFQTAYGMELLATVHWVATQEGASSADEALAAVQAWNDRKRKLMGESHIKAAWSRLTDQAWLAH
ncbi:MAG: macro domain-containing protein [Burkholderiales bacterium]|nr:macro domain-containing protein [Burkholderiales bacterium]